MFMGRLGEPDQTNGPLINADFDDRPEVFSGFCGLFVALVRIVYARAHLLFDIRGDLV